MSDSTYDDNRYVDDGWRPISHQEALELIEEHIGCVLGCLNKLIDMQTAYADRVLGIHLQAAEKMLAQQQQFAAEVLRRTGEHNG